MFRIGFIVLFLVIFVGCGGGSSTTYDSNTSATTDIGSSSNFPSYEENTTSSTVVSSSEASFFSSDRAFLRSLFETQYLWYDRIDTTIDVSGFDDPNTMIDALRYKELDLWSYAETYEEYEAFANQTSSGSFGFSYNPQTFQILYLVLGSPAYVAGLQRGDIITHINDINITSEVLQNAKANLNVEATFSVLRGGEVVTITMAPAVYSYTVTQHKLFETAQGSTVGWLRYDQFSSSSVAEFEESFTYFKEANIDTLIIDLRYNGGGSLTVASILMDKIAGYTNDGEVQFTLQYNDLYSYKNSYYAFEKDDNTLSSLSRVIFLTTGGSASASEVVINSLKPYIDVYTIGATTHGKPVGMGGQSYGDYVYWLINFSIVNVNGDGDFYDGIAPTCEAEDNFNYPRDDSNENMLKEALYFVDNGLCLEDN